MKIQKNSNFLPNSNFCCDAGHILIEVKFLRLFVKVRIISGGGAISIAYTSTCFCLNAVSAGEKKQKLQ